MTSVSAGIGVRTCIPRATYLYVEIFVQTRGENSSQYTQYTHSAHGPLKYARHRSRSSHLAARATKQCLVPKHVVHAHTYLAALLHMREPKHDHKRRAQHTRRAVSPHRCPTNLSSTSPHPPLAQHARTRRLPRARRFREKQKPFRTSGG